VQDKELYAQILGIRSPWSVDLVELKLGMEKFTFIWFMRPE